MRILGLDLSLTATGWAVIDSAEGLLSAGVIPTKPHQFPTTLARQVYIAQRVLEYGVAKFGCDRVGIEGYSFGSKGDALFQLAELGGIVRYCLAVDCQLPYVEVPPGRWRKVLFGKGSLAKDQVRVMALKKLAVEFDDLNTLEAYCVARYMLLESPSTAQEAPKQPESGETRLLALRARRARSGAL